MRYLYVSLVFVMILSGALLCQSPDTKDWVVTTKGWGEVKVGQSAEDVNSILGPPAHFGPPVGNVIFAVYAWNEVDFAFRAETQRLWAICFHNPENRSAHKASVFRMNEGVNWNSTDDDVIKAFGAPIKTITTTYRRRLEYETMLFLFNDHRMTGACITDGKGDFRLR